MHSGPRAAGKSRVHRMRASARRALPTLVPAVRGVRENPHDFQHLGPVAGAAARLADPDRVAGTILPPASVELSAASGLPHAGSGEGRALAHMAQSPWARIEDRTF